MVVEVLSESARAVVCRDFHYNVDDRICRLAEILVSYNATGAVYQLTVAGERMVVSAYVKALQSLGRRGELIFREKSTIRYPQHCTLGRELVESIWESLPPHPWPGDLHRRIARQFGVSRTQAWAAIGLFLREGRTPQTAVE